MQVSQRALAYMLLCALLCGAVLGGLYDLLSIIRHRRIGRSLRAVRLGEKMKLPPALQWRGGGYAKRQNREWPEYVGLFFFDLFFCLLFAVVAVLLLYYTNDGQWRLSVPVFMLAAFLLYRATLGRLIRCVLDVLLTLLEALLLWSVAILLYPFRWLWRLTAKPRRALAGYFRRLRERCTSYIRAQKEKYKAKRQSKEAVAEQKTPQNRRPPDGKTVFSRGGYNSMN